MCKWQTHTYIHTLRYVKSSLDCLSGELTNVTFQLNCRILFEIKLIEDVNNVLSSISIKYVFTGYLLKYRNYYRRHWENSWRKINFETILNLLSCFRMFEIKISIALNNIFMFVSNYFKCIWNRILPCKMPFLRYVTLTFRGNHSEKQNMSFFDIKYKLYSKQNLLAGKKRAITRYEFRISLAVSTAFTFIERTPMTGVTFIQ